MQHLIKSFMNIKNSIGPTSFLLKMILHGLGRRFAVSRQAAFLRQVAEDSLWSVVIMTFWQFLYDQLCAFRVSTNLQLERTLHLKCAANTWAHKAFNFLVNVKIEYCLHVCRTWFFTSPNPNQLQWAEYLSRLVTAKGTGPQGRTGPYLMWTWLHAQAALWDVCSQSGGPVWQTARSEGNRKKAVWAGQQQKTLSNTHVYY